MKRTILSFFLCAITLGSSGCSTFHTEPLVYGTLGGAAAGAGTGAIVGAVIANGDIAASALLGGAIGLPVGLALGAIYDYNSELSVRERKAIELEKNQAELFARQREIDELREQIRNDGPTGNPEEGERRYHYTGPSLGNYYR